MANFTDRSDRKAYSMVSQLKSAPRSILLSISMGVVALLALLWPAVWNRGPFYFIDTRTYMRSIDAAMLKVAHRGVGWASNETATAAPQATASNPQNTAPSDSHVRSLEQQEAAKGVMLGRSLYYGFLLYLGAYTGGFWLTILAQAAVVLLALALALRAAHLPQSALPSIAILLGLVSGVSFFICYLMPDLFAGITVLLCALLITRPERGALSDLLLTATLLTASLLTHDTCILAALVMVLLAAGYRLLRRSRQSWSGVIAIGASLLIAGAGESVVNYGIQRMTARQPLRFPLIEARLIEDGPGTRYLRATCPQNGLALCEYVSEFPLSTYDFLFSAEPGKAVYETASYERRRELSAEQFRFLVHVAEYDPAGVAWAIVRNTARQAADFSLSFFHYPPHVIGTIKQSFPLPVIAQISKGAAYRGQMPDRAMTVVLYLAVLVSLIYLLLAWKGRIAGRAMNTQSRELFAWICIGILLNAAICGGISAIESRYQARVIWLLPMLACIVEAQSRLARAKPANETANHLDGSN